ncbi:hypothetical protein [Streptomyces sp. 2A115]|uniref:hypothetical protein n=1 Tax=Streptomyces sp. 2A115 TaxID=3457439 RepID=UPI003FD05731
MTSPRGRSVDGNSHSGDQNSRPPHHYEPSRIELAGLLKEVEPWDELERTHLETAAEWIASGAPLYRTRKPDVPPTHLVVYFVVLDEWRGRMLLVAHRKAGL